MQLDDLTILLLGVLVIGVQIGQAVGLQRHIQSSSPAVPVRALWVLACAFSAVCFVPVGYLRLPATCGLGVCLGYISIRTAIGLLVSGSRWKYQRLFAFRNLLWLTALLLSSTLINPSIGTIGVATLATWMTFEWKTRGNVPYSQNGHGALRTALPIAGFHAVTLLGVGASLLYRNDVSLLRAQYLGTEEFAVVYLASVLYSLLAAIVGVSVTQVVYPMLRAVGSDAYRLFIMNRLNPLVLAVCAVMLSVAAMGHMLGIGVIMAVAAVIGANSSLSAAEFHYRGRSHIVYAIGAMSFLVYFCAVKLGLRADFGIVGFNLIASLGYRMVWAGDRGPFSGSAIRLRN